MPAVSGICVAVAATGVVLAQMPERVTLAWQHTVEKTRWEEDYERRGDRLVLTEARIAGTGAGMEMPPDAVLRDGMWHYRPQVPPLREVVFTNSLLPRGYEICVRDRCETLRAIIGPNVRRLVLAPCNRDPRAPRDGASHTTGATQGDDAGVQESTKR